MRFEDIVDGLHAEVLEIDNPEHGDEILFYVAVANCADRTTADACAEQVNSMFAQIAEGTFDDKESD